VSDLLGVLTAISRCCVWLNRPRTLRRSTQSGSYRGTYFVLMGHLSPLDGIGPDQLDSRSSKRCSRRAT
jgi:recombinational DNA repair protein RecR